MPLPPLPANNTDRYWLKYTSALLEHEMCFRLGDTTTQADGIAVATTLANALNDYLTPSDAFTALRYSPAGSDLSFPLSWTTIAGAGPGTYELDDRTNFFSLVGRSAGGYRCRITFFTPYHSDTDGFRVPTSTAGAAAVLYSTVVGLSPTLRAVDGLGVVWNGYVNTGWNAYWQRELR